MAKLTKRTVDAAKPSGKRYTIWDPEIRGFGLLVLPSGVKSFVYQYRNIHGRQRRITIGKYGDWTPAQARQKADEYHRARKDGRDPLSEKKAAREAPTVGDVLDAYLNSARFKEKADSTRPIDKGRIERHLRPLLGKKVVAELRADDIRRAYADIRDGRTAAKIKTKSRGLARVRGGETTAGDTIGLLRTIFNWAVDEKIIANNPAQGLKLIRRNRRDIVMRGPEDYRRLFAALDDAQATKEIRPAAADAIRVIALTGARRGEISGLRWRHVHLDRGVLILDRHKTAQSTGEDRTIGLPSTAQAIIAARAEGQPEPDAYVFPPARGEGPINLSQPWRTIRTKAELPEGIGLHGLRHSLATMMAMEGAQAAEIMTALGHRQMATAQRYVHYAQDRRAALAEKAAGTITGTMQGGDAKVIPLKQGSGDGR